MHTTEPASISVLICDDHVIVRHGLDALLNSQDRITLVGKAASGQEAIDLCDKLLPDVVLMDLRMPEMDGVTAIQQILTAHPQIKVIALTSYDAQDLIEGAIHAGAIGYLMKNVTGQELADAIIAAARGIPTISPEVMQHLLHARTHSSNGHDVLTSREHEVLTLMVQGLKNADIAAKLSVSPYTIKNHVSNILAKLNVSTRTEAVSYAIGYQIVEIDEDFRHSSRDQLDRLDRLNGLSY